MERYDEGLRLNYLCLLLKSNNPQCRNPPNNIDLNESKTPMPEQPQIQNANLNSHHTLLHTDHNPTACPRRTPISNPFIIAERGEKGERWRGIEKEETKAIANLY